MPMHARRRFWEYDYAAGPEHHDRPARGVDHVPQRLQKTLAVRVFADEFIAPSYRAIDGAHCGGRLAHAIEVFDHRHFVRYRAIEPYPAHGPGALHRIAKIFGRHLAIDVTNVQVTL